MALITGNERLDAARRPHPRAIHRPGAADELGEQRFLEERQIARDDNDPFMPRGIERGVDGADRAGPRHTIDVDDESEVREPIRIAGHHEHIVSDPLQNVDLSNDDGAAMHDQAALVLTAKASRLATGQNRCRRGATHAPIMTERRTGRHSKHSGGSSFLLAFRLVPALLSLLILSSAAGAQPAPGSRVLVMPFAAGVDPQAPGGAGTSLWLGEAAAVLLGEGLANEGVGALTREERVAAFDRLQLPMSAALTRATMIRVGELTGASDLVFGEVELGGTFRVRVRLIRLGPGAERPSVEDAATLPEMFTLFDRVARRVADETGRIRARASRTAAPLPLEAFELYVKGLVAATPAARAAIPRKRDANRAD